MSDAQRSSNRSVSRALRVLQAINRYGSLNMMQISKAVALPYPTTCRLVNTLLAENVIEQEPSRKYYRPTALAQSLSCGYHAQTRLVAIARPHIHDLTCLTSWPVAIASRVGAQMVIQDSTHSVTTMTFSEYTPGFAMPILSCASGLAYLAYIKQAGRRDIIARTNFDLVDDPAANAIRTRSEPYFESIRDAGYAFYVRNPHTKDPGKTSSIAIPLMHGEDVIGAMALSFFSSVMHVEEAFKQFGEIMLDAQAKINRDLQEVRLFQPSQLSFAEDVGKGKSPINEPAG